MIASSCSSEFGLDRDATNKGACMITHTAVDDLNPALIFVVRLFIVIYIYGFL